MSLVDKLKFHLLFKLDAVETLIRRWKPIGCKTEKDFEKSLAAYLREEMPGLEIIQQYALGRFKADIMVGKRLLIEIKNNLKSVNDCNRLIGQLDEYKRWEGYVIVLLTGNTCPEMRHRIERWIKEVNDTELIILRMSVVTK